MSKITYPKCPYCQKEYRDKHGIYDLQNLVRDETVKEKIVLCDNELCNRRFRVKVHVTYYASKIKE